MQLSSILQFYNYTRYHILVGLLRFPTPKGQLGVSAGKPFWVVLAIPHITGKSVGTSPVL